MVYGDIVLWAVFGPVALVAIGFTIRALIGWTGLRRDAEEDFDYRSQHSMIPAGVEKAEFVATYRRVNGPRTSTYAAAALWGALLATPLIAKIMEVLLELLWQLSGRSRVFEPGYLVWAFFIFFGLMGSWALIGFLVARRYHARTPARFEDELKSLSNPS
ncbi:hypothetical protein GCM10007853_19550 [Algimonas ampicilliniresistens]|jgi:hypothetical protein|uniref:Uncharacterized protein n=1 Tax=Algimonas ampicilliniresistens TaxID=1298735 RepID=A0ABQ5VBW0_9PROT|nr:hypothetical protein [Algimonas ampicilliniresistens]GLQ24081.1 hypothetical protein GCM10007853_19550 [Algimonas ampicilliniresistens]